MPRRKPVNRQARRVSGREKRIQDYASSFQRQQVEGLVFPGTNIHLKECKKEESSGIMEGSRWYLVKEGNSELVR